MGGNDAGEEAHRGSGVSAVDIAGGLREAAARSLDDECSFARVLDVRPKRTHRAHGGEAVLSLEESGDHGAPLGERGEHGAAVRHTLVSRDGDVCADRAAGTDRKGLHG